MKFFVLLLIFLLAFGKHGCTRVIIYFPWDDSEVVKELIASGHDVNSHLVSPYDVPGELSEFSDYTPDSLPIVGVSYTCEISPLKILIEAGVDVNKRTRRDFAALMAAAGNGCLETAEILIERGAKVSAKDVYGRTALHHAASEGKKDMVKLLLSHGAAVDSLSEDGWSPLFETAEYMRIDLERNIDIHVLTAETLLEADADVNRKDKKGHTPLFYAVKEMHVELIELLISRGAYVNELNRNGDSLLQILTKEWIEYEVRARFRDENHYPRMVKRKFRDIEKILRKSGAVEVNNFHCSHREKLSIRGIIEFLKFSI